MKYKGKKIPTKLVPIVTSCNHALGAIGEFIINTGEKDPITIREKFDVLILDSLADDIMKCIEKLLQERNIKE